MTRQTRLSLLEMLRDLPVFFALLWAGSTVLGIASLVIYDDPEAMVGCFVAAVISFGFFIVVTQWIEHLTRPRVIRRRRLS